MEEIEINDLDPSQQEPEDEDDDSETSFVTADEDLTVWGDPIDDYLESRESKLPTMGTHLDKFFNGRAYEAKQ